MSEYVTRLTDCEPPSVQRATPPLASIDIELTERCDNDCVHCCICLPEHDAEAARREMSTGEVQAVLSQAADLGALTVRFTGGEPLIREDFEELYLFARRLGLRVVLFTNARGVTPAIADLLERVPPLGLVEVSVYGMSRGSYESASRRRGSFDEFRRGVELLLDRGVPFVVKGALLPGLRAEVAEFEQWAATLPAMDTRPAYALFFALRGRRDSEARNDLIRSVRLSPTEGAEFVARDRERYAGSMRSFSAAFLRPPGDKLFPCGAGHSACVDAYGNVQACLSLRAPETVVSLRGRGDAAGPDGLRYALTEAFPRLRELRATDPEYLRRCARCFLKSLCEQCPARSWEEHGTLDRPVEYLCEVAHAQARWLGWLADGEHAWQVTDWTERIAGYTVKSVDGPADN